MDLGAFDKSRYLFKWVVSNKKLFVSYTQGPPGAKERYTMGRMAHCEAYLNRPFVAKIRGSICSYLLNIWYETNRSHDINLLCLGSGSVWQLPVETCNHRLGIALSWRRNPSSSECQIVLNWNWEYSTFAAISVHVCKRGLQILSSYNTEKPPQKEIDNCNCCSFCIASAVAMIARSDSSLLHWTPQKNKSQNWHTPIIHSRTCTLGTQNLLFSDHLVDNL